MAAASMATTEEKHVEQPFIITDVDQINKLIADEYSLEEITRKVVGRDPERRVCKWCHCGIRMCIYPKIQDAYDFLMYMYHNDEKCKEDPIKWLDTNAFACVTLKMSEKLFLIRTYLLNKICGNCRDDKNLIEQVLKCTSAQSIDDFLTIFKYRGYCLPSAIETIFDIIYPNNCLSSMACEIKYAIMCWILVIKGHVKNEESFYDFRSY
jgi:hypothetical protein